MAKSIKLSLVEVSPSTVMALKERSAPRFKRSCSTGAGSLASVKAKANMVAMSGAIMPEPLAMPLIVTLVSPIRTWRLAPLG